MRFSLNDVNDFEKNIRREWVLTNGIGGYAGSSVIGAHCRTHQGYLIASLHPPVNRYVCFSKTDEKITCNKKTYDLATAQYKGSIRINGHQYLKDFVYDGSTVCYIYEIENIILKKQITLVRGKNTCAIAYDITNNGDDAVLTVTPFMNFREHSGSSSPSDLDFEVNKLEHGFALSPRSMPDYIISLEASRGVVAKRDKIFATDMELQIEVDNETDGLDSHFTPYDINIDIPAKSSAKFSLICSVEQKSNISAYTIDQKNTNISDDTAFKICDANRKRMDELIKQSGLSDEFAQALVAAADCFITYRASTYSSTILAGLPWFSDWGRDTMIAYTGLTLCTKRFDDAKQILYTFAKYCEGGLLPNMFPDDGQEPIYNTADASLWYFYAVYKYLEYTDNDDSYEFVEKTIYPVLKSIIETYKNGTDFSIYMDSDYLIHAGSGLDQVTWMDVRVGDWVATPRHGKPVEINALWYNALRVMESLAKRFGDNSVYYASLAENTKKSFNEKFWNEEKKCLYDVVDEVSDDTIRPNQIYAVSLPFTMLSKEKEYSIIDIVHKKLYVGCGLRSLDPSHKDYHPIYLGSLDKRDHAYHQGTAWGFLLGAFISAYTKVNGKNSETAKNALKLISPVKDHLYQNCIGSICEIFDGDAPHNGRGCYAQAWSVGEVLRCYCEDIFPYITE